MSSTPTSTDVWIYDIERGTSTRATRSLNTKNPVWTPDGEHIVFTTPEGLRKLRLGSTEDPETLYPDTSYNVARESLDEGRTLLMGLRRGETGFDTVTLGTETGEVTNILAGKFTEAGGDLSPNGELLCYVSNSSDQLEVYATRWDDPGVSWQVSDNGGTDPRWSPDGTSIYYLREAQEELWAVDVEPGPTPQLSPPRLLASKFFHMLGYRPNYDIASDGRFLTIKTKDEARQAPRELRVLPGWVQEQAAAAVS